MILLRILKNSRSPGIAAVFLLALAMFIPDLWQEEYLMPAGGMPLFQLLFGPIQAHPVPDWLLALLLYLTMAYILVRMGVRFVLLESRSLMPAFFMVFFAMALHPAHHLSQELVGSVFYLLSFSILLDIHDKEPGTMKVFNASLVLALGCLFYLKLLWFIPMIWAAVFTLKKANWRELLYPVITVLLMFFFLFTWYWGIRDDISSLGEIIASNLAFEKWPAPAHISIYIYYAYLLILVLIASLNMINRFQSKKTLVQNIYQVFFFMFMAGLFFLVFVSRLNPTALIFISFPVAFILSSYFHRKRNHWIRELALWILLGLLVYVQLVS